MYNTFLHRYLVIELINSLLVVSRKYGRSLYGNILSGAYLSLLGIINSSTVSIRAIYSFFSVQFVSDISLLFGLNV